MNGSRQVVGAVATGIGTNGAKRSRGPKIAPVTRAVRAALAVSAAAFAFAGSGVAFAGDCTAPVDNVVHCNGDFVDTINFAVEDLTLVVGDGSPSTVIPGPGDVGILADWAGSIGVTNLADITTYAADGIHAEGTGDVALENEGSVSSYGPGDIIGIYVYSDGGDVTVANSGSVYAYSYNALADGIFASGANVDVSNSATGSIYAAGATWAAGIEAQGDDLTTVVNEGEIDVLAFAGGYSFGIYATAGDGASASNSGDITANGFYSNGIYVQSGGDAHADNSGTITSGSLNYAIIGTGIHVASSALDGVATVDNSGDIIAQGYYGATGIEALASNAGGTVSITNTGTIYAGQFDKYLYGATGIAASADGDASIDNAGGIDVFSGGLAYGAIALSFNGDASVTNSGDISIESTAFLYYGATGIVSASQNGAAFVDNSGSVDLITKYIGTGIDASGGAGATVASSGDIVVDAWRAYGIAANAGAGDVDVSNSGSISTLYSQGSGDNGIGILATTGVGDVHVANSGTIHSDIYGQAVGIFAAPGEGSATVSNSGTIQADSYDNTGVGIFARADYGDVAVDNSGSIGAYSYYGYAYGVLGSAIDMSVSNSGTIEASGFYAAAGVAVSGEDLTTVDNSGSITAVAYGVARGINATSYDGDVHVDNSGSLQAGSLLLDAIGIYGYSTDGDVAIHNDGTIVAVAPNGLADGIFASGANVEVSNGAEGAIAAYGYSWAAGIEAQGSDSVAVTNEGDIYVRTYGVSEAFGIYAGGGAGGASVDNSGAISVRGYDSAVAIYAQATGPIDITNSGTVLAGYVEDVGGNTYSSSYASGILALSGTDGAAISIDNSGAVSAYSFAGSNGIEARSLGVDGTVDISNSGDISVFALSANGGIASGIAASASGDAWIDNSGSVYAFSAGIAYGAIALSFNGDASVVNSGDIDAINTAYPYYSAYGVVAASQNGAASADNSGTIYAYSPYIGVGMEVGGLEGTTAVNSGDIEANAWVSYGVRAASGLGDVAVDNSGSIAAHYTGYYSAYLAFGINAETVAGDIAIDNSGDISADAGVQAFGIFASTTSGDITVDNSGLVTAMSVTNLAAPIFATNTSGDVTIDNSGSLDGYSVVSTAAGAFARATAGTASITNSGDIGSVSVYGGAYGILARGAYAEAMNSGDIVVEGYASAHGVYLDSNGDASLDSSGSIEATAVGDAFGGFVYSFIGEASVVNSGDIAANATYGLAVGVLANGYYGATVTNSGSIGAGAGPYGTAVGVYARAYGDVLVQNSGTISATHDDVAIAVQMESLYGTATLENSGTIETDTSVAGSIAVVGSNGVNEIHNTGDINGAIVTFAAEDSFANGSGGTWLVENGTTYFGGGDDSIDNGAGGTIHLAGGGIYLGASGANGNSFHNAGTIRASGYGLIDMGMGATALVNDGAISFLDGAPDDLLVIAGDLGGDGAINLDISLLNGTSDLLYVDGDVVDGTSQAINLAIDGLDGVLAGGSAPVVAVSGSVAANAFTGGSVLNVDPSNFLDLEVAVSGDGAGLFTASVDVTGLNDAGVVAGSVANAAHSLINSSIGTRNQRLGLAPVLAEGDVGLGPWIRVFSDDGDVAPDAAGFGSDRDFGFAQENRGTEFGMNFSLVNGISFGVMGGNAEGTQKLTGAQGGDEIDLHTSGLYASWAGAHFYADVSMRWMDFDARLMSIGGEQRTSGNATAFNLEGGYTGWTLGGFNIVPQAQYTRSVIDNVDVVEGTETGMAIYGGVSERARVGVAVDRSFTGGMGITWTPFGALSAVREMDGNTGFTVADRFGGRASTSGNSTLAEIGVGLQRGRVSATVGANWADGGALDGFTGGQLVLRYTW